MELLVVIAIIGVLVALLLPAVQQAREAAHRAQCKSHLRQLGLALHNYHDSHQTFPPAVIPPPGARAIREPAQYGWGWAALLLPYLEEGNVYDRAGIGRGGLLQDQLDGAADVALPIFRCASDDAPPLNPDSWFIQTHYPPQTGTLNAVATSNYVALHHHREHQVDDWDLDPGNDQYTGGFGLMRATKIAHITDGTSNTIAVGERAYQLQGERMYAAVWPGCVRSVHDDCIDDILATGRGPINPSPALYVINVRQQSLSSQHPGGCQVAMFDGSVHFLSENIHFIGGAAAANVSPIDSTFERLIGISDGQPIGEY